MAPKKKRSTSTRSRSRSTHTPRKRTTATPSKWPLYDQPASEIVASSAEKSYFDHVERRFTPENDRWDGRYDFKGPLGVVFIMIFSHIIIYYFYVCIDNFGGTIIYPTHPLLGGKRMDEVFISYLMEHAWPSLQTFLIYFAFLLMEYVLAVLLPGVTVKGLPLPSENGYRLSYKCNAVHAWYFTLLVVAILHYTGVFPLSQLRLHYGEYLTTAALTADVLSVWLYMCGLKRKIRMTPSFIYNFFMGSALNFRLPGNVDLKLFAECRNSWVLLMLLTLSCATTQYEELGYLSLNMIFIIVAQLLYANAVQKGEECVPMTWDIYYEKFGWMLVYWNTCGVPFLYCMQSMYIQTILKDRQHPQWVIALMTTLLLAAYYIWDTVNSQKNRFRMQRNGVPRDIIYRRTFPQLRWRFIENPRTLKSERGELFIDGFYRYGRKIHYTVDVIMAFLWGCSCGFDSFIPFFYFFFFVFHLIDREYRDEQRCKNKYGNLWEKYIHIVPYKFIPYVY